jgi:hypothetical protein
MTLRPNLRHLVYTTAIALACFSGAVSTAGLMRLVPGGELVVAGMGLMFEAGKLVSFALLHRRLPRTLKIALASLGTVLMVANIAGVSGFLSNAYEHRQISAQATGHVAEQTARASADLIERQLAAAESTLSAARTAQIRARDDKARAKAARQIVDQATAERDTLVAKLATARTSKAQAEGDTITAGGEFAAIRFIAEATGANEDRVAHLAILTLAGLPDFLAVALILAAGLLAPKAKTVRTRKAPRRRRPTRPAELKVVELN